MRSSVTSVFCPVSVHWMFSSRFLLLLKLLEQTRAAQPDIWGTSSQTHVGKPGRSCRTQPLPARARAMPPSPGSQGTHPRGGKATGYKRPLVPPSPSRACFVRLGQGGDVNITSRGLAACGCAGNSREARLLLTQPFKLTPYVPYFSACFVSTEISDSLPLQNRKQHIML